MNLRELAIYFAGIAHQDQTYGESPYLYHLAEVDDVLSDAMYCEDSPVRIASWLHDSIEDSEGRVTYEILDKHFGPSIAGIVQAVTNEPGANRKDRAKKTYPKIAAYGDEAIALKLADRIANMEHSLELYSRFGLMYVKEDPYFSQVIWPALPKYSKSLPDQIDCPYLSYLWPRYRSAIARTKKKFGIAE